MIITKTPFRVSFFGGGTDYRPWFEKNGGFVISAALNKYCYISVRRLAPFFEYKTRIVYSISEMVNSHKEIKHPSIRHCLEYLKIRGGLEIHHDGDLPARTGIGSSSSFTVGFLLALHALKFRMITKSDLAAQAIKLEQEVMKENVGIQDQIIAAYGGIQTIDMGPGDKYCVSPLILPPAYRTELERHVLLAFTGISRNSQQFAKAKIKNINNGKSISQLDEMLSISRMAYTLFYRNAELKEIGKLMDENWQLKKTLTTKLSNSDINDIYDIGKKAGAYGGKLMGAGGGGFIMFMAPPDKHAAIKEKLKNIKVWVPFKIDKEGAKIILLNHDR